MPRPFTRTQALQNAAFLKALRRTGNVREACRSVGLHRATYLKRRAKNPAFAADWDAALTIAHAALNSSPSSSRGGGPRAQRVVEGPRGQAVALEPHIIRTKSGRLQLRRALPQRLTRAAEQAFLAALSATANVRLSAAAAGFSHSAFYHRRKTSPAFAREMRLALEMGYERLEMALIESFAADSYADDAWRHNDPPPIPAMTANQALQLLYLHHKTTRLWAEAPYMKKRRGETTEQWSHRRAADYIAQKARERDEIAVGVAARAAYRAGVRPSPHEPPPPVLPALDQVTGWSKADAGKAAHDETRALFGGWRLSDVDGDKTGGKKRR